MHIKKRRLLKRAVTDKKLQERHVLLRVIAGITRFRILSLLSAAGASLNVSEIADILESSVSTVSHELSILRKTGLVASKRQGREVHYKTSTQAEAILDCR